MSEKDKPLEFSAIDLMPDWAQEKKSEPAKQRDRPAPREGRRDDRRDSNRGGGDRRNDSRGGGDRRDFGGRGGGGDRRGGGGRPGGGRDRNQRGNDRGRGRDRNGRDDRRDRPREEPLPKGITASVEPADRAIEGLVKHIKESNRVFPIADLAKMILKGRDRYQVRFQSEENAKFYQCPADQSLWTNRDEALAHILQSEALATYYSVEEVETEAPKGNFSAVAVCGMSGVILGPTNHHEFQRSVSKLHKERFAHMSLERFKEKIRTESGEEIVEKWKEQVSRVLHYRVKGEEAEATEVGEEAPKSETSEPVAEVGETESADTATPEESTAVDPKEASEVVEDPAVETEEATAEDEIEAIDKSAAPEETAEKEGPAGEVFKTHEALAQHFRANYADDAVVELTTAVVPGDVTAKLLSRGLFALMVRETQSLQRGFPLAMIQALCRCLEKHNLRFFKRGKKALHVSAIRPKALSASVSLTEQVQEIVDWVRGHPKRPVVELLDALADDFQKPEGHDGGEVKELPEGARVVLKNLHWLTSEGYILEFPDSKLALGKMDPPAAKKTVTKKKVAVENKEVGKKEVEELVVENAPAPAPAPEPEPEPEPEPPKSS